MATYCDFGGHTGFNGNMKQSFEASLLNKEDSKSTGPLQLKIPYKNGKLQSLSDRSVAKNNGADGAGMVSFSTNHNSVVCLPLVSEGFKLVWTQSEQTRELDSVPELIQMFNVFPYPTSRELSALACLCTLPLDKVKVWFMVQRIKYGISWTSEEIEETRLKLAGPDDHGIKFGKDECKVEDKEIKKGFTTHCSPQRHLAKKTKNGPSDPPNPSGVPKFSFSLPPPEDSFYYRQPVDVPAAATAASEVTLKNPPPSLQQHRPSRYKKSKAQLGLLRSSFQQDNWPDESELRRLQGETGLSRNDIRKWFSDSRYQLRSGRADSGVISPQKGQSDPQLPTPTESQQLQPLSLVARKPRNQANGVAPKAPQRGKTVCNGSQESGFFKTFLQNRLEAFNASEARGAESSNATDEPSTVEYKEEPVEPKAKEEALGNDDDQPLKLTAESSEEKIPIVLQLVSVSSPSGTPPPASAALPRQRSSTDVQSTQRRNSPVKVNPSTISSSPSTGTSLQLTAAGRPRKTKEQLDILKQHFLLCQWPTSEDYTKLVGLTGLPRADVIQWFGDTRYAVKHGQLRWVGEIREQIVAEITQQQNLVNGNTGGGPRGSRKRKSQGGSTLKGSATTAENTLYLKPLESYLQQTGALLEKDLDILCRKSKMSYQQVRDWFASQETVSKPILSNVSD